MLHTLPEDTTTEDKESNSMEVEPVDLNELLVSLDHHAEEEDMYEQARVAAKAMLTKLEDQSRALLKRTAKNTEKKSEWLAKRMEDERTKLESYTSHTETARSKKKAANDKLEAAKKAEVWKQNYSLLYVGLLYRLTFNVIR